MHANSGGIVLQPRAVTVFRVTACDGRQGAPRRAAAAGATCSSSGHQAATRLGHTRGSKALFVSEPRGLAPPQQQQQQHFAGDALTGAPGRGLRCLLSTRGRARGSAPPGRPVSLSLFVHPQRATAGCSRRPAEAQPRLGPWLGLRRGLRPCRRNPRQFAFFTGRGDKFGIQFGARTAASAIVASAARRPGVSARRGNSRPEAME